ncbi:Ig-like domain-containing protein [Pontibacter sp. G13]|uniref:Ig-like domain-containing protein n=1 Tax=Pontibacter sp. G13 TaxID=3074898 RepID=UPI00288A34B9|nr:Ig-like domain-containing protein [Pontibacter sp. G13]WNJ19053.1 Ig-like domain-containing protein [Pontibacter sp. G13]
MTKYSIPFLGMIWCLLFAPNLYGQSTNVDVNLNIKHEVNGVSDFGRDRHITVHASLAEPDWIGEQDKIAYLLDSLDVFLGRDNGSATWKFQYTAEDANNPNHPDLDSLEEFNNWYKGHYEQILSDNNLNPYESRSTGMIMGTNPHPTYPTLSYWYMCGTEWGRQNGYDWIPQDIETSAEWMVEYLDKGFVSSLADSGELRPEYWEVINEPDMKMNTGAFMITSWEDIWEYHNLVATGVKARLGANAPKIGGMTWGLHDFFADDLHRSRTVGYSDSYYGNTPADEVAKAYARQQTESAYLNQTGPWTQWDVLWKGFMDNAGHNMDFYSVHIYDWPNYNASGGTIRSGGHTEAMLEMIEWYDVHENGFANRKPIVISEYGAVQGAWDYLPHDRRYDWECLKPFNSMMMQFLERPDYIVKSMPFTPMKAEWWKAAYGVDYHYRMLEEQNGDWVWTDYIKWYELWRDVKGTRVDTRSEDPDVLVDCYIDGSTAYLILNNLEDDATTVNLNFFDDYSTSIQNVKSRHMYLQGTDNIMLDETNLGSAPSSVLLQGDGTMILVYEFGGNITIDETSNEKKYFGESVSGGSVPHRINIAGGANTFNINGVSVPSNAEVMLKITGALFNDDDDKVGHLSIDELKVNGTVVPTPLDWRGTNQNRSRYFGTLEIPIPANLIQTNNTIEVDFHHVGEVTVANLVVWEFSQAPGRTNSTPSVDVTGVTMSPLTASLNPTQTQQLSATVAPSNATNQAVTWSSNNTGVATVDAQGLVTAVAAGSATITVTTVDGGYTATAGITVTDPPTGGGSGHQIVIEAENFDRTGGTYNDGFVPNGVNVNGNLGINWVNSGDYAEYDIIVDSAGVYDIVFYISTPVAGNTEVELFLDGVSITSVAVPNNGQWDAYQPLAAPNSMTLTAGAHTVRILASGSNAWQWNLDKVILTKVGDLSTGVAVTGVSVAPATLALTAGGTGQLQATVTPSNASNPAVTWSSSNPNVATVNGSGSVSAVAQGTATITATTVDGGFTATAQVNVASASGSETLVIEAESFATTGGTYNGFQIYTVGPVTATNWNQTGDWADYAVTIQEGGTYSIEYFMGTTVNGAAVEIILDGTSIRTDAVPNNGNWDNFVSLEAGGTVNITPGAHTIRLLGAGTNGWEWNMDYFVLSNDFSGARRADLDTSPIVVYPNPADDFLQISGMPFGNYRVNMLNSVGQLVQTREFTDTELIKTDISELPAGMYYLQIQGADVNETIAVQIQ